MLTLGLILAAFVAAACAGASLVLFAPPASIGAAVVCGLIFAGAVMVLLAPRPRNEREYERAGA